jgi:hypothetical protein
MRNQLSPKQTLLLILLPMYGVFIGQRLYLHLVRVQHFYPGGYLLHHLYTGSLLLVPASFVLAFGARNRLLACLAPVAIGIGSALVLDELVYLVATQASDDDYTSAVSLCGALVFLFLATLLLLMLYRLQRGQPTSKAPAPCSPPYNHPQ